jgi:hypothetical protein
VIGNLILSSLPLSWSLSPATTDFFKLISIGSLCDSPWIFMPRMSIIIPTAIHILPVRPRSGLKSGRSNSMSIRRYYLSYSCLGLMVMPYEESVSFVLQREQCDLLLRNLSFSFSNSLRR